MSYRRKTSNSPAQNAGVSRFERGDDELIKFEQTTRKFDICSLCVGCVALRGLDRAKLEPVSGSYLVSTHYPRATDRKSPYWSQSYHEVAAYDGDNVSHDTVKVDYYGVPGESPPLKQDTLIANAERCAKMCGGPYGDYCGAGEYGLLVVRDYMEQRWDMHSGKPYDASGIRIRYAVPELAENIYSAIKP
jgi:hypothetical protein